MTNEEFNLAFVMLLTDSTLLYNLDSLLQYFAVLETCGRFRSEKISTLGSVDIKCHFLCMHDMASVFYLKIFDTFCSILWLPESIRVKQFFEERITVSRDNGLSQ